MWTSFVERARDSQVTSIPLWGALALYLIHSNCELRALPAFGDVGAPRRPLSPVG